MASKLPVKLYVRQFGIQSTTYDVKSVDEVEEDIAYKFIGYELQTSHYLGEVRDGQNGVVGYKVLFVFVAK